jgi:hypothetical protein
MASRRTDSPFAPGADPNPPPARQDRSSWRYVDPVFPDAEVLARHHALVLDPLVAFRLPDPDPAVRSLPPRPTVYVADTMIVPTTVAFAPDLRQLLKDAAAAENLVWEGLPELPDPPEGAGSADSSDQTSAESSAPAKDAASDDPRPDPSDPVVVGRLVPFGDRPVAAPDAWSVLQRARAAAGTGALRRRLAGVSLNHLFFGCSHVAGHPVSGQSHVAGHPVTEPDGLAEYVMAGSGGRAPVSWVGEVPDYEPDRDAGRPVVAVLDTGCGKHPWFEQGVNRDVTWGTRHAAAEIADPEIHGDLVGPMDGALDSHAGHGTFIAGVIRQICPVAEIWAIRVMSSDGIVQETDLIQALGVLNGLVADTLAAGERPPVDIVSLSLGYYHELPGDQDFDPVLLQQIQALGEAGVAVLACAGNDATTREMYPAAFLPHAGGIVNQPSRDCVPVVSVGALNPDGSVALFSNGGDWVWSWEVGAALVSTFPTTFNGGGQPSISIPTSLGRRRATIDPDRFCAGFGTWSGTSFSTPVLAGRLAKRLLSLLAEESLAEADPVERMWLAVTEETGLQRP